ncbi:hypothetical protein DPEC_G00114240 [Dallia pectoralis]|uniref:Uncharacterized protein n=1 Tax=Dallia pectoralis TaxID=75939 RepID=A0ACC2GUP1_DALPE|nr:hypothetical protein DPEC_G00114240 [Dallia pectoralis]
MHTELGQPIRELTAKAAIYFHGAPESFEHAAQRATCLSADVPGAGQSPNPATHDDQWLSFSRGHGSNRIPYPGRGIKHRWMLSVSVPTLLLRGHMTDAVAMKVLPTARLTLLETTNQHRVPVSSRIHSIPDIRSKLAGHGFKSTDIRTSQKTLAADYI